MKPVFRFLRNMFSHEDHEMLETAEEYFKDGNDEILNNIEDDVYAQFEIDINFDENKDSILLIDDNEGIISFLQDDLDTLNRNNALDLAKYNLLSFTTKHAGFFLKKSLEKYNGLNIKYAIIDITLGGNVIDPDKGNVVIDGIDVFGMIKQYNPDFEYVFFTGNKLNPYIKKNKIIIEKFKTLANDSIENHVMYKNEYTMDERIQEIGKMLKGA